MTKYILIILMLLAPIAGASADNLTPSPISIVPCPVRVVPGKGNFTFSDKTVFSVENHEQAVIARNFIDLFKKSSGIIYIVLLNILVGLYIFAASRRDRAAAWLFVPYLLWTLFAAYLNGYIDRKSTRLNSSHRT